MSEEQLELFFEEQDQYHLGYDSMGDDRTNYVLVKVKSDKSDDKHYYIYEKLDGINIFRQVESLETEGWVKLKIQSNTPVAWCINDIVALHMSQSIEIKNGVHTTATFSPTLYFYKTKDELIGNNFDIFL
jgi:hypothetical protein